MANNISELRKQLSIYINRPSKLGFGNADIIEVYQFLDMITNLCQEHSDPKFEYDGDTKCCICLEYYHENDNIDQIRIKLQKCPHHAHKDCVFQRLKKNETCCHQEVCYKTENWDKSWRDNILNDIQQVTAANSGARREPPPRQSNYEPQNQSQLFNQEQQQIQNREACPICKKAFTGYNNTRENIICHHVYCNPCYSKMIADYKVGGLFRVNEVICKACKKELDLGAIKDVDNLYFNQIVQKRDEEFMKQFL